MSAVKFAYLCKGKPGSESEFEKMYFRQLELAEAGRCIESMKYQTVNAFCKYGRKIERDPNIQPTKLDETRKRTLAGFCYIGAYYLELEEELDDNRGIYRRHVYFILIPSNSNSIFTFYDVKCA